MSQGAAVRSTVRPVVRPVGRQRPAPPRLRVVAPVAGGSRARLALVCLALLGTGLLGLLMLNISLGSGSAELAREQAALRDLSYQQQQLQEQVEAAGAPQNLLAQARKLGMVPARNVAFVRLPDGRVIGEPAKATAPPAPKPTAAPTAATGPAVKPGVPAKPGAQPTGAARPTTVSKAPAGTKPAGTKPTGAPRKPAAGPTAGAPARTP